MGQKSFYPTLRSQKQPRQHLQHELKSAGMSASSMKCGRPGPGARWRGAASMRALSCCVCHRWNKSSSPTCCCERWLASTCAEEVAWRLRVIADGGMRVIADGCFERKQKIRRVGKGPLKVSPWFWLLPGRVQRYLGRRRSHIPDLKSTVNTARCLHTRRRQESSHRSSSCSAEGRQRQRQAVPATRPSDSRQRQNSVADEDQPAPDTPPSEASSNIPRKSAREEKKIHVGGPPGRGARTR